MMYLLFFCVIAVNFDDNIPCVIRLFVYYNDYIFLRKKNFLFPVNRRISNDYNLEQLLFFNR